MSRKKMSRMLQGCVILFSVICAVFFFTFLPEYGKETVRCFPEYAWAFWPCLIWAWIFSLPIFCAAIPAWNIFGSIRQKGDAFSFENASRFRLLAKLAWIDAAIFPAGMVILAFMGAGSPALTLLITPAVMLIGAVFGFMCYVMSRLVRESAELRQENDLTI